MAVTDPVALSTFNALASYLQDIGLTDLFRVSSDGTPSGWLWDRIVEGVDTADQLAVAIEATSSFQQRYGIITELRQRAAAGEPVHVPSISEVREYEDTMRSRMKMAGLPEWFYDSYQDAHDLMRKDISLVELDQRIAQGWTLVREADPAVRQAFSDFYGVADGDSALAAFMLDPDKTMGQIERAARVSYTAGYGRTMGLQLGRDISERLAATPSTLGGILQDLGEAAGMQNIGVEGITETQDITDENLLSATALGDGESKARIERRILERQANERSSTGGAALTNRGAVGLRSS